MENGIAGSDTAVWTELNGWIVYFMEPGPL
jgi:hypothetical protein